MHTRLLGLSLALCACAPPAELPSVFELQERCLFREPGGDEIVRALCAPADEEQQGFAIRCLVRHNDLHGWCRRSVAWNCRRICLPTPCPESALDACASLLRSSSQADDSDDTCFA